MEWAGAMLPRRNHRAFRAAGRIRKRSQQASVERGVPSATKDLRPPFLIGRPVSRWHGWTVWTAWTLAAWI